MYSLRISFSYHNTTMTTTVLNGLDLFQQLLKKTLYGTIM